MSDVAMQALERPSLIDEIRAEVERVRDDDPGFNRYPLLLAAINRRLELTSIS
jgi:hypothetical protein